MSKVEHKGGLAAETERTRQALAEVAERAMIERERRHPQDNSRRVLIVPPPSEPRTRTEIRNATGKRISRGAMQRARKAAKPRAQWDWNRDVMTSAPVPRVYRADVLKIMRRMRQRIADKRWSGVPT